MNEQGSHPDEQSEANHLTSMLDLARRFSMTPVPDDVLAYLAATRLLDQQPREADMHERLRELEARIEADPELQERYESIVDSMKKLDSESNARYQFESLVDRKMHVVEKPRSRSTEKGFAKVDTPVKSKSTSAEHESPIKERGINSHSHRNRKQSSTEDDSRVRRIRSSLAVAAAILLLFASLAVLSYVSTPETQRIAYYDKEEFSLDGFGDVSRSGSPASENGVHRQYLDGLEAFGSARSSTFGLFPRYDDQQISAADEYFQSVINTADEGGFLHTEALFWHAQVQLIMQNTEQAISHLQQVVSLNGRMAAESERQLGQLR